MKQTNPWDRARKLTLHRGRFVLEGGVNYFVLMIEQLGGTTCFSCEGHPGDFYIVFRAPYRVATKIASMGYLPVTINRRPQWFRLSLESDRLERNRLGLNRVELKEKILQWAAKAWDEGLGPLLWSKIKKRRPISCPCLLRAMRRKRRKFSKCV